MERRARTLVAANLGVDVDRVDMASAFEELDADVNGIASILVDIAAVFGLQVLEEHDGELITVGGQVAFLNEYFRRDDRRHLNQAGQLDEHPK